MSQTEEKKIDQYKIDGDKIEYHPERVNQWLSGSKTVYPIYVEITPAGACNHRCTFCAVDYIGYKTVYPKTDVLLERLTEMGALGVRSIMYAGEGEPLLNKDLAKIIRHTKETAGIDASITTNATALTRKFSEETLPFTQWIKASINAGEAKAYSEIHKTDISHFEKVWNNMGTAVKVRESLGLKKNEHTLGAQMVLIPENSANAFDFANRAKSEGLDYAVIKPYSQHKFSITQQYANLRYEDYIENLGEKLETLNSDNFKVIFREKAMKNLENEKHSYERCPSTPHFWAYIMGNGDVYGCSAYLLDERFNYGNIHNNTFKEIWEGEKRMQSLDYVANHLDISECRMNCRMGRVNETLVKIKDSGKQAEMPLGPKPDHINFI